MRFWPTSLSLAPYQLVSRQVRQLIRIMKMKLKQLISSLKVLVVSILEIEGVRILISIAVLVIWLALYLNHDAKRVAFLNTILPELPQLVLQCKAMGDGAIEIHGRCLVLDMSEKDVSSVQRLLPREMKAEYNESHITIFVVTTLRQEYVGRYAVSDQPAFRQYADVCIIAWPEKKPLGMHSIISREPRHTRIVESNPEFGDPNAPVAAWIKELPRIK